MVPAGLGLGAVTATSATLHGCGNDGAASAAENVEEADQEHRSPARVGIDEEVRPPEHRRLGEGPGGIEHTGEDVPSGVLDPADVADLLRHHGEVPAQVQDGLPEAVEEVRGPREEVANHSGRPVVEGQ